MKIVYFGTDVFLKIFSYFLEHHTVLALYTYHNPEDYFTEENIVRLSHIKGIPVSYEKPTKEQMECFIKGQACELFFVAEYSHVLPIPKGVPGFRAVNVHNSLLPQGRGYYPIENAMGERGSYTGVTIHKLTERIDEGDILLQRRVLITPEDDSVDIYLKCAHAGWIMARRLMEHFAAYWENAVSQAETPHQSGESYRYRPPDERLCITHEMSAAEAKQIFSCFNKLTYVVIDGQLFRIAGLMTGNEKIGETDRDIVFVNASRVIYGLHDGNIRIDIEAVF